MRIGASGLIDGSALQRSDLPVSPMGADAQALVDAFVRKRASALSEIAGRGQERRYAENLSTVGWDTHSDNWYQSRHFEELFGYLSRLMTELSTPLVSGHLGATLLALVDIAPGTFTKGLDPIEAALA